MLFTVCREFSPIISVGVRTLRVPLESGVLGGGNHQSFALQREPLTRSMRLKGSGLGLLDMLGDVHVDDTTSFMDCVLSQCSVTALAMLSAASHSYHDHCRAGLLERRVSMEKDLATRLGYLYHEEPEPWNLLQNVRALTIPDTLPETLRPLLGTWLQTHGRLAQVNCIACRSWVRSGEIFGWIELDSVRAGEPQLMSPEERYALQALDTTDGLLKAVLKHAQCSQERKLIGNL